MRLNLSNTRDPIGGEWTYGKRKAMQLGSCKRTCVKDTKILCLLESPRTTIAPEAIAHAEYLFHVTDQLRELFDEIAAVLRRVDLN
jgi:hypothetical protein